MQINLEQNLKKQQGHSKTLQRVREKREKSNITFKLRTKTQ